MKDLSNFSEGRPELTQDTASTNTDGSQPSGTRRSFFSSTAETVSSVLLYLAGGVDSLVSLGSSKYHVPTETKWKIVELTDEEAFDSIPEVDRLKDKTILDGFTACIHWNAELFEGYFEKKQAFPIDIFRRRGESFLGTFVLLVGNIAGPAGSFDGSQGMRLSFSARGNIDRITSQCICQLNKAGRLYALVTLTPSEDERRLGENYVGPWIPTHELEFRWKRSAAAAASVTQKS